MAQSLFPGVLQQGIYNDERVRAVQLALNATIQAGLDPDADFGKLTRDAVISFQTSMGLPSTGVVDRKTWDLLMGPSTVSPQPGLVSPPIAQDGGIPLWVWGIGIIGLAWWLKGQR